MFFTAMIVAAGLAAKGQCTVSPASSSPTVCVGTALAAITHTTTGATGVGTPANLPAGVSVVFASNTITISGTPTVAGTFNYTIPLDGCSPAVNAIGTIIVKPVPKINNKRDTICSGTAFTVTPSDGDVDIVPDGTIYRWSNLKGDWRELGAMANINSPESNISQTLTNESDTVQSVIYTVYPESNGCPVTFGEISFTLTISVNPILKITHLSPESDTVDYNGVSQTLEIEVNILKAKYQWQDSVRDRVWRDITGGNVANYTPPALTETTYFRCKVVSDCGEDTTSGIIPVYVVGNSIVSLPTATETKAFTVSPNPVRDGCFTVSFNRDLFKDVLGNYLLSVYSITGAKIWEQKINCFDDIAVTQLMASGFYTIVLVVDNKQYSREIIIK